MRLEIGPDGKIIGTRRVSPNGQVSGLSEFAGREVLVILPGSSDGDSSPPWGSPEAIARAVEEQVREAYQRYELLQKLYATPWDATRSFVRSVFAGSAPDLVGQVDRWVDEQIRGAPAGNASTKHSSQDEPGARSSHDRPRDDANRSGAQGPSHRRKTGRQV
jgi:hypothetical protein